MALLGTALALVVFGPGAAEAQKSGTAAMSIGTTAKYEGVTPLPSDCQNEASYEQFMKVAGQVILPETRANVYKFIEYWGRDSGTQVQRTAANGDVFLYLSRGVEQRVFVNGPVGTYWDVTDPESGTTLRFVIAEDGITLTLPTSPEAGLPIQIWTWEGVEECSGQTRPPRRHWLVSITRK